MSLNELHKAILETISTKQPIKARYIADILTARYKIDFTRTEINSQLYGALSNDVERNEFFEWSLWQDAREAPPKYNPPKEDYDPDCVNLDSIVKIRYSNGQELLVGFALYETFRLTPKKGNVTYVYYKTALAKVLLGKKVGAAGDVGYRFKIVQVD